MAHSAVVSFLADLVAIPSVNPSLVEGGAGEGAIADAIATWMRRQRFDVDVQEVLQDAQRCRDGRQWTARSDGHVLRALGHGRVPTAWRRRSIR